MSTVTAHRDGLRVALESLAAGDRAAAEGVLAHGGAMRVLLGRPVRFKEVDAVVPPIRREDLQPVPEKLRRDALGEIGVFRAGRDVLVADGEAEAAQFADDAQQLLRAALSVAASNRNDPVTIAARDLLRHLTGAGSSLHREGGPR